MMAHYDRLDGIYYPYADLRPSQSLLEACLYLDCVYIFEPNFFRPPTSDAESDRIPRAPSMDPLLASGLVEPIGPQLLNMASSPWPTTVPLFDDENLNMVRSSIDDDMNDELLTRMAADAGFVSWEIPTGQQLFWNGLGLLLDRPVTKARIRTHRDAYYQDFLRRIGYPEVKVTRRVEKRVEYGQPDLQVEVPFLEAESLMLTLALLASSELGLYPFTDSVFHEKFLRRKLSRMMAIPEIQEALSPLRGTTRKAELGLHTLRINLPRLSELDAEKVVELRGKCHDSLEQFRVHLRSLSYKIQADPWAADFEQDIHRVIATDIEPALRELRHQFGDKSRSLGVRLATATVKSAPVPLLLTLATGIPPIIALAAGAGVTAILELAQYLVDRRPLKRHGLYFLLEAKPLS